LLWQFGAASLSESNRTTAACDKSSLPLRKAVNSPGSASFAKQQLDYLLLDIGETMTGYFDRVFARIGIGTFENGNQHFVQRLSIINICDVKYVFFA
jgi:hypothetical protein